MSHRLVFILVYNLGTNASNSSKVQWPVGIIVEMLQLAAKKEHIKKQKKAPPTDKRTPLWFIPKTD